MTRIKPPAVCMTKTERTVRFSIYGSAMHVETAWDRSNASGAKIARERTRIAAKMIAWRAQLVREHLDAIALEMAELRSLPKSDPL